MLTLQHDPSPTLNTRILCLSVKLEELRVSGGVITSTRPPPEQSPVQTLHYDDSNFLNFLSILLFSFNSFLIGMLKKLLSTISDRFD